ncbi:MAG: hypothetical protein WDM87_02850 [Terracidiphilus sp.]
MRLPFVILLSSCALVLAGCAGMPAITTSNTDSIPGTVLHGSVHGGQNPIAGAHVYLYAINTTGYGGPGIAASSTNASVSLLHSGAGTAQTAAAITTSPPTRTATSPSPAITRVPATIPIPTFMRPAAIPASAQV